MAAFTNQEDLHVEGWKKGVGAGRGKFTFKREITVVALFKCTVWFVFVKERHIQNDCNFFVNIYYISEERNSIEGTVCSRQFR